MAHDVVSLITVIEGILEEDRVLDDYEKALLESLLEKATCLKNLLEKSVTQQHHKRGNKEIIHQLQSEIRDAAHEAEDIIESHAVDRMISEPEAGIFTIDIHSTRKVMEKFDAANDKLTEIIKEDYPHQIPHDEASLSVAADPTSSKTKTTVMVGFEEDAVQLKHRLTSTTSAREIIPIVGMGGIGKTTLARNLYNDPLIVSHFDVCAWVTVSQDFSVRAILLGLLGSILRNISEVMLQRNDNELGDELYRRLYDQRYLVVLDDVWSEKAWDEIQRYLPRENRGSRILITSRELDVAKNPDPTCKEHQLHLLSDAQGWDLLRHKVFEKDEHCPSFFEEIGRKIASDCGGLPLAISVIGGLLCVEKHSEALWGRVARDVRSITNNHISEILCLSYDNLPLHLKPCFLYMSAFPEDFEVRRSKLVKLLVAEGFLWMSNGKNKSLEDVAEEHLKALVDRNLLSVTKTKYNGRAESYSMHDLLRDLCVRKAHEEKFLHIMVKYENFNCFRRVSFHHQFAKDEPDGLAEDLSGSRSLMFTRRPTSRLTNISPILSRLRLVRVLDVSNIFFRYFPVEILKLANLRFLAVYIVSSLPSALWRLRNLQTLVVHIPGPGSNVILPHEAWEISGLRHIILRNYKSIDIDFKVPRVHENLQTISGVFLHGLLASNLINNIPNIKKLGIDANGFDSEDRIVDLSQLHRLETLKLYNFGVAVLSLLKLPNCIKKLSFYRCTLPMGLVNGVGDLQNLEVLKIKDCIFQSEEHIEEGEWELDEGVELSSLQFLELRELEIVRWKADYSQFPRLRHLRIRDCGDLKEIPACIGETLEMIEVYKYNPSHMGWANEVRETQQYEYGNENLQIIAGN